MTARALGAKLWQREAWSIGLVCFGLRAVSLFRACLSDDEAIYAVVAREMLSGRSLYRDVVDHKPPLIYFVYALTQAAGGPRGGMVLLHLVTIAVVLATAFLLSRLARERAELPPDSRAPWWAALLYAVFTTTLLPFDALAANCELFMMLPLTASVLFFLRGAADLRARPLFLSGLLLGVAALCKYQAWVQLGLYGALLVMLHWRRAHRAVLASGVVGAGALSPLVAAIAVFAALGSLDAAWFWFRFNFAYIKTGFSLQDTLERAATRVSFVAASAAFLWLLGTRAAVLAWRRSPVPMTFARFAALWALVSALAVTTGGRFFGHYFHQLTAPLAVLAAPAAAQLWQQRRRLVVTAVGVPALAFFLLGAFQSQLFAAVGAAPPDYRRMSALVAAHARPGDQLVVWGNLPVLYFEAEKPLGTRFVFSNYMTGLSPATPSQSDPSVDASPNIVPESWPMFEADLADRRPRLVLDSSPGNVAAYGKFPPSSFPRLQTLLDRDYRLAAEDAGVRLFVRREGLD
jgi:4-amino-4-deoxy-L-arabinose transferase-like glycosyltransferase